MFLIKSSLYCDIIIVEELGSLWILTFFRNDLTGQQSVGGGIRWQGELEFSVLRL